MKPSCGNERGVSSCDEQRIHLGFQYIFQPLRGQDHPRVSGNRTALLGGQDGFIDARAIVMLRVVEDLQRTCDVQQFGLVMDHNDDFSWRSHGVLAGSCLMLVAPWIGTPRQVGIHEMRPCARRIAQHTGPGAPTGCRRRKSNQTAGMSRAISVSLPLFIS